ncbi:helix-turn-helix domain-containing protein [Cryobacterium sp. Y57]|uniref:helix-turn-helix domain-containing protein n=1 Tax=Cryobacterium sp. Y57 TaxID=2048287 RepID=UPI000CE2C15B|nr:helix-turn-helix domain-containing protein [Cryobacterium sp. Y57]
MPDATNPYDLDGLRAVAHPLRLRLLSLLTAEALSATEAARVLGESQANVSYHLRRLAQAGFVQLVEEMNIRGGTAKRYRHDPASGEALGSGRVDEHQALMGSLAAELIARSARYLSESEFVFTEAEVTVSREAWERIRDKSREIGKIIHDEAVPPATPEGIRMSATLAVFEVVNHDTAREHE